MSVAFEEPLEEAPPGSLQHDGAIASPGSQVVHSLFTEAEENTSGHSSVADHILSILHARDNHPVHVQGALDDAIAFRKRMVNILAVRNSERDQRWSLDDWKSYFAEHCFGAEDMTHVMECWKREFVENHMCSETKKKVQDSREIGSREEKNKAHQTERGALRAWEMETYGSPHIVRCFLKFPVVTANPDVQLKGFMTDYAEWIRTDLHAAQKSRSSKDKSDDDRLRDQRRKLKCHRLRFKCRMARALAKKRDHLVLDDAQSRLLRQYENGDLQRQCDEATREHGFGQLLQEDTFLRNPCFMDSQEQQWR